MQTNFDNSWQALLQPGEATHYFNIDYPTIQIDAQKFSTINALWMAELSHLIYKRNADEDQNKVGKPTRNEMLQKVALHETRFFNAGPTQCAVVESQHDSSPPFAVLVFRGSIDFQDWLANLNAFPTAWPAGGSVHRGFKAALEEVWGEVEAYLATLTVPVFYTGHSLGAALATLAAAKRPPQALYTFGAPLVGDANFASNFNKIKFYRIVNNSDLVTTVPPSLLSGFCHAGELQYITHNNRLLVNPTSAEMAAMVWESSNTSLPGSLDFRQWYYPPRFLADHAPVNYVAHLERLL
jgi:predicted lipase